MSKLGLLLLLFLLFDLVQVFNVRRAQITCSFLFPFVLYECLNRRYLRIYYHFCSTQVERTTTGQIDAIAVIAFERLNCTYCGVRTSNANLLS